VGLIQLDQVLKVT